MKNYLLRDGKLREVSEKDLDAWKQDERRESIGTLYHGAEGKKLAERILEHGDELDALHADGKDRLLAAGLTEEEYDLWHYGAFNIQDVKKLEDAMRRIRK
jgi:hypothetical protein